MNATSKSAEKTAGSHTGGFPFMNMNNTESRQFTHQIHFENQQINDSQKEGILTPYDRKKPNTSYYVNSSSVEKATKT